MDKSPADKFNNASSELIVIALPYLVLAVLLGFVLIWLYHKFYKNN